MTLDPDVVARLERSRSSPEDLAVFLDALPADTAVELVEAGYIALEGLTGQRAAAIEAHEATAAAATATTDLERLEANVDELDGDDLGIALVLAGTDDPAAVLTELGLDASRAHLVDGYLFVAGVSTEDLERTILELRRR